MLIDLQYAKEKKRTMYAPHKLMLVKPGQNGHRFRELTQDVNKSRKNFQMRFDLFFIEKLDFSHYLSMRTLYFSSIYESVDLTNWGDI